jgi:ribosomal protein S18 acetylase RimI-like enzyme
MADSTTSNPGDQDQNVQSHHPPPHSTPQDAIIERIDPESSRYRNALALAISPPNSKSSATRDAVSEFLDAVKRQQLSATPTFALYANGQCIAAATAVRSPGRTALVFLGYDNTINPIAPLTKPLLSAITTECLDADTRLLQSLIPPNSNELAIAFQNAGYRYLAELRYMEADVTRRPPVENPNTHLTYINYSPDTAPQFIETLKQTYQDSKDCPGLDGVRDVRDVIVGHQHTGISHPATLWFLALQNQKPVGTILLSKVIRRSALEVVYMGVVPNARGKRLSDSLLSMAFEVARDSHAKSISLAVDETNTPARRAYDRWNFTEIARRRAWILHRP